MRNYMPPPHRRLIETQPSLRESVRRLAHAGGSQGGRLRDAYNACVLEVAAFRAKHFDYAVNYIEKRVSDPLATGGTPYVPWLRQLLEDTKGHVL
jgi:indoleamine 2,3-dioxygenase